MRQSARAIIVSTAIALALTRAAAGIGQEASPKPIAAATPTAAAKQSPFDQCAVCHSTDGSNGTGPTLKGVFGRPSGTVPGFRYSRAMRSAGITWDGKTLDQYLNSPQEFIAGNIMPFSGVPDAAERASIIAYLRALK
jgi:cytochrome c